MSPTKPRADSRLEELIDWLGGFDNVERGDLTPASVDASFRRYFRYRIGTRSFIVMDAPPPQEDCRPFVRVAGYLEAMQLNAPRVLEADIDRGFLLLTDLGEVPYLQQLESEPSSSGKLYNDALDALQKMQDRGVAYQSQLPPYDAQLLEFELSLFHDWLCGTHVGLRFDAADEMAWCEICSLLIRNALDQPQVFVHRDYHSRNLMLVTNGNPGILDFQDAVEGPLTYDLVSLVKDCYIRWPVKRVREWAVQFYAGLGHNIRDRVDFDLFIRYFELMGVQRHLKAAGIFARLNHRDGKPAYLEAIPRTLSYVTEFDGRYDELQPLIEVIRQQVLPAFEQSS